MKCVYILDGIKLVIVGFNNIICVYKIGLDGEFDNVDDC